MGESAARGSSAWPTATDILGVVVEAQTYRNLLYLALAYPLGFLYFVGLVTGFALGIGLAVILVGIPILVGVVIATRAIASFERGLANRLLAVDIHPPADVSGGEAEGLWQTVKRYLGADSTWNGLVFCFLKLYLGLFSFVLVVVSITVTAAFLTAPLHYDDPVVNVGVGWWAIDTLPKALIGFVFGAAFGVGALHAMNAAARGSGLVAKALLGGEELEEGEDGQDDEDGQEVAE